MAFVFIVLSVLIVGSWLFAIDPSAMTSRRLLNHRFGAATLVVALGLTLALTYHGDRLLVALVFLAVILYGGFAWHFARTLSDGSPHVSEQYGNELHLVEREEHDAPRPHRFM